MPFYLCLRTVGACNVGCAINPALRTGLLLIAPSELVSFALLLTGLSWFYVKNKVGEKVFP